LNQVDNCKYIFNPNKKDSNADGISDICWDDDNDGIIWEKDNCINISNSDKKDQDNDWFDICVTIVIYTILIRKITIKTIYEINVKRKKFKEENDDYKDGILNIESNR